MKIKEAQQGSEFHYQ